jgi:5'-nucleotidase
MADATGVRCRRGCCLISTPSGRPKKSRDHPGEAQPATSIAERHDPKGRSYYRIEEGQDEWEPHDRSDYQAVRDGYVSLTPLHPDLTAHHALAALEELSFEHEAKVR